MPIVDASALHFCDSSQWFATFHIPLLDLSDLENLGANAGGWRRSMGIDITIIACL
jgi:hypothetical protein